MINLHLRRNPPESKPEHNSRDRDSAVSEFIYLRQRRRPKDQQPESDRGRSERPH